VHDTLSFPRFHPQIREKGENIFIEIMVFYGEHTNSFKQRGQKGLFVALAYITVIFKIKREGEKEKGKHSLLGVVA